MSSIEQVRNKSWYNGPDFVYRKREGRKRETLTVHVTASASPLKAVPLSSPVLSLIEKASQKQVAVSRTLDFGAGCWLRYVEPILTKLPETELHVVEYEEAFSGSAAATYLGLKSRFTHWSPGEFADVDESFDLILVVNVLNTIPETLHHQQIFRFLSKRLNPLGWLAVYQRVWAQNDNLPTAIPYGEGWIIPLQRQDACTYRAKTGAQWFNAEARGARLRPLQLGIPMTSGNTIFKVWEKPV